jgi:hypothetical protein
MGDEFDPVLLEKIEAKILPLLEQMAEQVVKQSKANPGEVSAAPVPFIIGDDVVYEDDEFVFVDFFGEETRTKDQIVIEGELTTAWMTHVMSELDEGDTYSLEDIMQMINEHLDSAA